MRALSTGASALLLRMVSVYGRNSPTPITALLVRLHDLQAAARQDRAARRFAAPGPGFSMNCSPREPATIENGAPDNACNVSVATVDGKLKSVGGVICSRYVPGAASGKR